MNDWLNGECPPGAPITVAERIGSLLDWIDQELAWATAGAHPALHAELQQCSAETIRVRDQFTDYDPNRANRLHEAWQAAEAAFNLPRDPTQKEDAWRGSRGLLETIDS